MHTEAAVLNSNPSTTVGELCDSQHPMGSQLLSALTFPDVLRIQTEVKVKSPEGWPCGVLGISVIPCPRPTAPVPASLVPTGRVLFFPSRLSSDQETKTGTQARLSLEPGTALVTIPIMANRSFLGLLCVHYTTFQCSALHLCPPCTKTHMCTHAYTYACTRTYSHMQRHIHML